MNIEKTMLLSIIEPITSIELRHLRSRSEELKGSKGESNNIDYAVGELLERAIRFIEMTLALTDEKECNEDIL